MPTRLFQFLGLVSAIDWKAMFVFVGAAVAIPIADTPLWADALVRLSMPIVGGVIWVFLKPRIIKWRNKK